MLVSQAIDQYLTHEAHRLALGIIKGPSLDRAREFALRARQFLPEQLVSELSWAQPTSVSSWLVQANAGAVAGCGTCGSGFAAGSSSSWRKGTSASRHVRAPCSHPRTGPSPSTCIHLRSSARCWSTPGPSSVPLRAGPVAGMNCGDVTALEPEHFDGHWVSQPRQKTGAARLVYVPSWVMDQLTETGIPIRSKYGTLKRRSVSTMWRDEAQKLLGKALPFTGLRTTLRSVVGHLDPEAVELPVMGLSASPLAGTPVAIKHYMSRDSISRERLRAVSKAVTEYVQSS